MSSNLNCILWVLILFISLPATAQHAMVEGYVYESDNRGFLNLARVELVNLKTEQTDTVVFSNQQGLFSFSANKSGNYLLRISKDQFYKKELEFRCDREDKQFVKVEMKRLNGYTFDVTLAPKRSSQNEVVDAITGARIEVYNNTKDIQPLDLKDHPYHNFEFHFKKGNHYTVMIRKEGYLTKRIEAYVNVEGCILCFDGLGSIEPGVSDNMHQGNEMGTLLANVELEPVEVGSKFVLENIYYDYDQWFIRDDAAEALDNLITVIKDNPKLEIELGSHTDSRGKDAYNLTLSEKRAASAVDYLVTYGGFNRKRITSRGYGERELTNECDDGVECDEEKHQLNRRTELKITGIREEDPLAKKSLAQIIREERFLANALMGTQHTYTDDSEEMPADLVAYIQKQKELEAENLVNEEQGWRIVDLPEDFNGYSLLLTTNAKLVNQIKSDVVIKDRIYKYEENGRQFFLTGKFRRLAKANRKFNELRTNLSQMEVLHFKNGKWTK